MNKAIAHSATRGDFIKTMHLARCLAIKSEPVCLLQGHSQAAEVSQCRVSGEEKNPQGVAFKLSNLANKKNKLT